MRGDLPHTGPELRHNGPMTTTLRLSARRADGSVAPAASRMSDVFGAGVWLVVVPHDDDLVLGLGLTVAAASREGIEVHVAVATDGSLGYGKPEERAALTTTRARELEAACTALGIARARVHHLGLRDGSLVLHQGCRSPDEPPTLSQRLVQLMRGVAPDHVFVCTPTDIHPDHRVAASETEIACFWASSRIWLDLGEPIHAPSLWHYAVYCPFEGEPDLEVAGDAGLLEQKLSALSCFRSQGVIEPMVARLRADGPFEYVRRARFEAYRPRTYRDLFEQRTADAHRGHAFREDCRLALEVLDQYPIAAAAQLDELLSLADRPLLIVGEGSSQLFPAKFAQALAARAGFGGRVLVAGGREANKMSLASYRVCLVSNSGSTKELVELVQSQHLDAVALLGSGRGPLSTLVPKHLALLPRPERVVAATVSVFAQALYLAQAVLQMTGQRPSIDALRVEVARLLDLDLTLTQVQASTLSNARRVFWADGGTGVGAELALKTMEVTGLPGLYAPGNLLLHGIEETLGAQDLVIWVDPSPEDRALREAIAESTGASSLVLGGAHGSWSLQDLGLLSPLAQLVLGWRVVEALALSQGRDPDRPRRARKVGNPASV